MIVERHGEPVAVVIPVAAYQQWQRQREEARVRLFELFKKSAECANMTAEDADALVSEVVADVRAARRAAALGAEHGA